MSQRDDLAPMTADDADEFARHATAAGYEAPGSYARGLEEGRAERDKRVRPCARCGDRLVVGTASSLTCCDTCALAIADEVHTGATETAREEGRVEVTAAVEAVLDPVLKALDGSREVIPYKQDDEVWMPCGNAYPDGYAKQRVTVLNHNAPPGSPLYVLCESRKCLTHYKLAQLPKRYQVTQEQLHTAAVQAVATLHAALGSSAGALARHDAQVLRDAADELRRVWIKEGKHQGQPGCYSSGYERWLRARAARIEQAATPDTEGGA